MKLIYCRLDRCLGCKACEIACAIEHSESKDLAAAVREEPRPAARVRVRGVDRQGEHGGLRCIAIRCRQCEDPVCVTACIAGGICKDEETGVVRFNKDKCVGCWSCTMVCPYGAIVRRPDGAFAVKCDQCGDREIPACVEACPTHALVFCEPEEFEALVADRNAVGRDDPLGRPRTSEAARPYQPDPTDHDVVGRDDPALRGASPPVAAPGGVGRPGTSEAARPYQPGHVKSSHEEIPHHRE